MPTTHRVGVEETLAVVHGMVAMVEPPMRAALEGVVAVLVTAGEVTHREQAQRTTALPRRMQLIHPKECAIALGVGMAC